VQQFDVVVVVVIDVWLDVSVDYDLYLKVIEQLMTYSMLVYPSY